MEDPYISPSARTPPEARQPISHAILAGVSGFIVAPIALFSIYIYQSGAAFQVPTDLSNQIRPLAFAAFGGCLAALAVFPLQRIKWYWAVLIGPVIAVIGMLLGAYVWFKVF